MTTSIDRRRRELERAGRSFSYDAETANKILAALGLTSKGDADGVLEKVTNAARKAATEELEAMADRKVYLVADATNGRKLDAPRMRRLRRLHTAIDKAHRVFASLDERSRRYVEELLDEEGDPAAGERLFWTSGEQEILPPERDRLDEARAALGVLSRALENIDEKVGETRRRRGRKRTPKGVRSFTRNLATIFTEVTGTRPKRPNTWPDTPDEKRTSHFVEFLEVAMPRWLYRQTKLEHLIHPLTRRKPFPGARKTPRSRP